MNYKKLTPIINAVGVIVMFLWGTLGNDWQHSWIAVCISGVISSVVYSIGKQNETNKE